MSENRSKWKVVLLVLLLAAVGTGGFFLGKARAGAVYKETQEWNARVNRSDLERLNKIEGPIYVTGHKSPDSDTVCSSIAFAALLQQLGYDAQAVVLEEVNKETRYILDEAGIEVPPVLEDAAGKNMILVDHSDYEQSAEGLEDANIVGIIDHHGDGSVRTGNQLVYDARPFGSTATIIWLRYCNYGLEPDPSIAKLMLGAILSDTVNLQSENTTEADREAAKVLGRLADVRAQDDSFREMYKELISYEGMTDEEIFLNDYKEYESGGTDFGIACVNIYSREEAPDMEKRMAEQMPLMLEETGMDMAFAMISIFHDDISVSYLVPSDEAAAEVLETAFEGAAEFDGTAYVLEPGVSRRQVLVPAVSDVLEAHPKE